MKDGYEKNFWSFIATRIDYEIKLLKLSSYGRKLSDILCIVFINNIKNLHRCLN